MSRWLPSKWIVYLYGLDYHTFLAMCFKEDLKIACAVIKTMLVVLFRGLYYPALCRLFHYEIRIPPNNQLGFNGMSSEMWGKKNCSLVSTTTAVSIFFFPLEKPQGDPKVRVGLSTWRQIFGLKKLVSKMILQPSCGWSQATSPFFSGEKTRNLPRKSPRHILSTQRD